MSFDIKQVPKTQYGTISALQVVSGPGSDSLLARLYDSCGHVGSRLHLRRNAESKGPLPWLVWVSCVEDDGIIIKGNMTPGFFQIDHY